MDHWDEVRMFLAVAEGGTVRAAAEALKVNHATIIRGVGRLEEKLNTKLFEKLATGYRLTDAGSDIVELAGQMATASSQIEARIFGRDQDVSGPLRFTLPISFATDLLMPTLTAFRANYPDIALEILSSGSVVNLGNREADVALRVVVGGASPPENLYGTELCEFHMGFYIARDLACSRSLTPAWLLGANEAVPTDWAPDAGIKMASVPIRFAEMRSQLEAVRAGMGISALPCFLGDADPLLARVPGGPVTHIGDIWLLTHGDTRRTKRVRLLCDDIRSAMQGFAGRLAGRFEGGASEFL
ncbi:LysR family transcriptional regulator [Phyllobacterium phragmitis]|uniref:LysR family transcriptional regulator n=1 Tax=Phyllobacterium phragmitis TaxID=2670329 RepID=A0A2S9IT71_9HYPH|nr:LysR family transcriptional regulator [Phyllobacterium phragmitis]PRD43734.1 LysR family transcriptional regulator [Phyllobacterium phragmitis]